ncbi:LON peptidase substrate-binding domain-containing protein [Xanthomonas phaseoli]|uniref:LON peptidase substrate-binding domain-containing protein n=1 Tax=Xanthomonas manihotis TaxID=43353 RepID=A0A8I1XNT8_XANMN|nr:LON peptidase substrate-binding domain-containing protein [Xanthomonas phaseoli]KUF36872.1 ATP-dependent protease [Xanthomonas phaseoli pv. manihotis]MBO9719300.1 LON peptidase substrate-binding domain-containing protein [Xanthomonas phaseoli pv. manihotis]MBO9755010.1 LON peptidase substrate-binding domain-containing protein [Xanthomonas phaseoli pv. manihotis]MBO9760940.1 LON peptidase substrate-binding domain-containing protein [Xanthomonas phaseoli pv. manihotis]MBO9763529.1 LON peptida
MVPLMPTGETSTLPLFPLHSVLLPGAAMGLRVFERRYLDLVRESGRTGSSFGVCLILEGAEVGAPATPAAFGTEVRIEDFDVGADGVLVLRLRGTRRFRVQRSRIRDNGLVVGQVGWCEPDSDDELRPEHSLLAMVLERMLEQVGGEFASVGPGLLDQAAWVGWRLAELLPLTEQQRLSLLQQDDPHRRLDQLLAWMP